MTVTYRNRPDGLCPRCAWSAESLIEEIEIESLGRDLELLTEFEAYCDMRDRVMRGGVRPVSDEIEDQVLGEDAVIIPTAKAMDMAFSWIEDPPMVFSRPFGFAIQPWSERRSA